MINRLATRDQLAKIKIIHDEKDKACVLCGDHFEDLEHLFFNYVITLRVWRRIFAWMEINIVEEGVRGNHYTEFISAWTDKVKRRNIDMLWLAGLWSNWI